MSEDPRNIVLLSADALRADHLSSYGYHRETSPVLDELAEESIRFSNAYSASSHTREAVPALLTGEYPDVAVDSGYHLATESVAETLSAEGSPRRASTRTRSFRERTASTGGSTTSTTTCIWARTS